MRVFSSDISGNRLGTAGFLMNRKLVWRMMLTAIPMISLVLAGLFLVTCRHVQKTVTSAIACNEQMHAELLAQNFEEKLLEARNQLKILAAGPISKEAMKQRLKLRISTDSFPYREIAYRSYDTPEKYVFIFLDGQFIELTENNYKDSHITPFQTINYATPSDIRISEPLDVSYYMILTGSSLQNPSFQVIRLSMPILNLDGKIQGTMMISLDLTIFRNLLTQKSYAHSSYLDEDDNRISRTSFFFDHEGWIIFQSEDPENSDYENLPLRSDKVRSGLKGDIGMNGFRGAFRPASQYTIYHEILNNIQNRRSGHFNLPSGDEGFSAGQSHAECISFAPVFFQGSAEKAPEVIGGIGLLDTTFTSSRAYSAILNYFLLAYFLTICTLSMVLFWIGRTSNRTVDAINLQLQERNENLSTEQLQLPPLPCDLEELRQNIDILLQRLQRSKTEHATQLAQSNARKLNEPVENLPKSEDFEGEVIIGTSPAILSLKQQIETIANVQGDVLVVGETGTGKELVSQEIHNASERADKPFISINCGALDENLLMDTLFGHVKGAFTEARQSRKGAFITADGGTLLLDEIGNATPKVQQALLRALSIRKIRPLGSDQDIEFSARIIAATNADLRNDGKENGFRNDLYFRLSVFSIQTPPLRERKKDIPALVVYFMSKLVENKENGMPDVIPEISRGALDKLLQYDWPGNVRELKNVITRALAFCKNDILQAGDIIIDEPEEKPVLPKENVIDIISTSNSKNNIKEVFSQLNRRQQSILPIIMEHGSITRQEYQKLSNEPISMRTAQYDLQQLVSLGLIRKEGRGSVMRYIVDGINI